jgi:CDP-glucose 4,6-dehydratase
MRSWSDGKTVKIRNPGATRPWQHVLEPLSGYLILGDKLAQQPEINGEPFNFGPPANQNHSVKDLIEEMQNYWNQIQWEDVSNKQNHLHEVGL